MKQPQTVANTVTALALALLAFGAQTVLADYATHISGTSPVGWWGMNETGGGSLTQTADLSGAYGAAHNQATTNINVLYNSPGLTVVTDEPGFVSGSANRAAHFQPASAATAAATPLGNGGTGHGPEDSGTIAQAIYRYPAGFAIEAWIKYGNPLSYLSADSQRVIATREFGFGYKNDGTALHFTTFGKQDYFNTGTAGGGNGTGSAISLNDGNWHQIGVSWDGNVTATFYLDGVKVGVYTGANGGLRAALDPAFNSLNLGRRNTSAAGQMFDGWLDEVVMWDHTRSDQDFAASFAAATTVPATLPKLSIRTSGTDVLISWPASFTGYTLQAVDNLLTGTWGGDFGTPSTVDASLVVTVPRTNSVRFFRLIK